MEVPNADDYREDLLSVREISDLLETEYQKYIKKHVENFFISYQSKLTNYLVFYEAPDQPQKDETFEDDSLY